jgi:hypothetical protein
MPKAVIPSMRVTIDGQALAGGSGLLVRALRCEVGMDGVGTCTLDLIVPSGASLPAPGAVLAVSLGLDDDNSPVFKGEVDGVRATLSSARVTASDAIARLANTFVAGAYAAQTVDKIARDVLGQAGVTIGTLDAGPELTNHVLFPGLSALQHLHHLAGLIGADLFCDGDGKVHLVAADTVGASHEFRYGNGVLAVDLALAPTPRAGVDVWGEGAGATEGAGKEHWLPDDLGGVKADADVAGDPVFASDAKLRRGFVRDGALRSGSAVGDAAKGRGLALTRPLRGTIEVTGAATVAPSDVVEIAELPDGHHLGDLLAAGKLRVRRVRHRLDTARGFTTRMEF